MIIDVPKEYINHGYSFKGQLMDGKIEYDPSSPTLFHYSERIGIIKEISDGHTLWYDEFSYTLDRLIGVSHIFFSDKMIDDNLYSISNNEYVVSRNPISVRCHCHPSIDDFMLERVLCS
jgi:hypothetical protein